MDIKELIKVTKLIESEEEKLKGSGINSYEQLESYLEEKGHQLSNNEMQFLYQYIKSNFNKKIVVDRYLQILQKINTEDKFQTILLMNSHEIYISSNRILSEDERKMALDYLDKVPEKERSKFIQAVGTIENSIKYINSNGKNKYLVMDAEVESAKKRDERKDEKEEEMEKNTGIFLKNFALNLENPVDITIFAIKAQVTSDSIKIKVNDEYLLRLLQIALPYSIDKEEKTYIAFLKKIGKIGEDVQDLDRKDIIDILVGLAKEYEGIKQKLSEFPSEEEKTNFLISIDNEYIKKSLLKAEIKSPSNRMRVIDSIDREVSPELKEEVKLAQKMIFEFVRDNSEGKFKTKAEEILYTIFKGTDVIYDENYNHPGVFQNTLDRIKMNAFKLEDKLYRLEILLHEYGHSIRAFSNRKNIGKAEEIEEGTQNIFAQEVINHYLKKHGSIELRGERLDTIYPVKVSNNYIDYESWMKTFMYLNESEGKDIDVLLSYKFGEEEKFIDMVFGEDYGKKYLLNGTVLYYRMKKDDLYEANKERLKSINKKSKYYEYNSILQEFERRQLPDVEEPEQ